MSKTYKLADAELFVFSEYVNQNPANGIKYYDSVCKFNGNIILFSKNIEDGESNIISKLILNLDPMKAQHLANVLKNNKNILAMISNNPEGDSFYAIYYDFTENVLTPYNLFNYMFSHSDFAEEGLFVEIHNGHQTVIKEFV